MEICAHWCHSGNWDNGLWWVGRWWWWSINNAHQHHIASNGGASVRPTPLSAWQRRRVGPYLKIKLVRLIARARAVSRLPRKPFHRWPRCQQLSTAAIKCWRCNRYTGRSLRNIHHINRSNNRNSRHSHSLMYSVYDVVVRWRLNTYI